MSSRYLLVEIGSKLTIKTLEKHVDLELYCLLWEDFLHYSGVSFFNFE